MSVVSCQFSGVRAPPPFSVSSLPPFSVSPIPRFSGSTLDLSPNYRQRLFQVDIPSVDGPAHDGPLDSDFGQCFEVPNGGNPSGGDYRDLSQGFESELARISKLDGPGDVIEEFRYLLESRFNRYGMELGQLLDELMSRIIH